MSNSLAILAIAAICAAAPLAAQPLAGIDDEEVTIRTDIREHVVGNGDVVFVRDALSRWYRVDLGKGCLAHPADARTIVFRPTPVTGYIDTNSTAALRQGERTCAIESIRRSAVPPQKNSASPVTLD